MFSNNLVVDRFSAPQSYSYCEEFSIPPLNPSHSLHTLDRAGDARTLLTVYTTGQILGGEVCVHDELTRLETYHFFTASTVYSSVY